MVWVGKEWVVNIEFLVSCVAWMCFPFSDVDMLWPGLCSDSDPDASRDAHVHTLGVPFVGQFDLYLAARMSVECEWGNLRWLTGVGVYFLHVCDSV
jgi:hypothetical protein